MTDPTDPTAPVPSAHLTTGAAPMNAPTSIAPLAALAALRADPASLAVDATIPGLAGVLVLFSPPSMRPTPTALRTAFEDAIDRAQHLVAHPAVFTAADVAAARAFLASLPDVVTPVAALGLAVRHARDSGCEWVHNRTVEKSSRWTYCTSAVTADSVSIHGASSAAEASPDGTLTIDAGVPSHVATALRAAYDAARGVVEPSRVKALIAAYLTRHGGRAITDACYLVPDTSPVTCGVLAGLADLGGWAETVAVADPARIARLTSPVTRSIEQQIADVVASVQEFIGRAQAVSAGSTTTTASGEVKPASIQKRSVETARAEIATVRAAALLWRDRLSLASLDVDAELDALDAAAVAANALARAAMEAR